MQFTDGVLFYVVKHKYPPLVFALLDPDGDGKPNITPSSSAYRKFFTFITCVGLIVQFRIVSMPWPLTSIFGALITPIWVCEFGLAWSVGVNMTSASA
jgi:hypothetical protein